MMLKPPCFTVGTVFIWCDVFLCQFFGILTEQVNMFIQHGFRFFFPLYKPGL